MTVATYVQPDKVAQNAQPSQYAANIDAATAVLAEVGANFAPHEAATPDMTVVVDAGKIQNGKNTLNVAQQTTPAFTAPTTDPRIDLILVDALDGSLVVIAGTEAATPVPPAITSTRYVLIAEVLLQTTTAAIDNSMITDRRSMIVTPMLNENDMASDSQEFPPTQASVKAYVDGSVPNIVSASGIFTVASLAAGASVSGEAIHGLGGSISGYNFNASILASDGTVLNSANVDLLLMLRNGATIESKSILGSPTGSHSFFLDGVIGYYIKNNTGATKSFSINWHISNV